MPIQYLGGKTKLAKRIAAVLEDGRADDEPVWDLCCGAGNVVAAMSDRGPRYGVDVVPCLVRLLCAVRDGSFVPPTEFTREQYAEFKARAATNPMDDDAMLAFVGFGLSWGAKWFAGYAANNAGRDYVGTASRKLVRQASSLRGVDFMCADWREVVSSGRVTGTVYIDPPYAGTTGYKAAGAYDLVDFWRRADELVERDGVRVVYVSEYAAPAHWLEVARWDGHKDINRGTRVERLFARSRSHRLIPTRCSAWNASWCPWCGDCNCNDVGLCRLHGRGSEHGIE